MLKLILIILASINFSKASFASEEALNDANLYTVKIRTSIDRAFREDKKAGIRTGSGFLINKNKGLIITNAHVTGRSKSKVRVAFKNYGFSTVEQIYVDPRVDIAIVKIDPKLIPNEAKEAKLNCNGEVPSGTSVAAFGHPRDLSFSASRGIVSKYRFNDFKSNLNLWTLQASLQWSKKKINKYKTDKSIMNQLILRFTRLTGLEKNKIIHKKIHGWKYSYNYQKTSLSSNWNKKYQLGICGDWFGGPKVENAWLSANDLAKKIK